MSSLAEELLAARSGAAIWNCETKRRRLRVPFLFEVIIALAGDFTS